MLYVYYGSGEVGVREAAYAKLADLKARYGPLAVSRIEPDVYEPGQLASLALSADLFGGAHAYLVDTPSLRAECFSELLDVAEGLAASANHFIVLEGALLAAPKKSLAACANAMTESKDEAVARFDTFKMADALAGKDKRTLWILLEDAVAEGLSAEEIIGVLWWQLKTMRLALLTKSAAEAGVKDFPYNKARRSLANFKAGEVEALSRSLLALYHDGHAGKTDITLALEAWVLRM